MLVWCESNVLTVFWGIIFLTMASALLLCISLTPPIHSLTPSLIASCLHQRQLSLPLSTCPYRNPCRRFGNSAKCPLHPTNQNGQVTNDSILRIAHVVWRAVIWSSLESSDLEQSGEQ